ncbi:MAG: hypothetical protein ACK5RA_09260 [Cyanobacteriota bacterium]|jgi:predicted nucleic acid-binding protein
MRITSKGQVTIPQEIREQCGLLPHTQVRFVDSNVILDVITADPRWQARGGSRQTVLADFLIGAHALLERVPLLSRDRRRYRQAFPGLELIAPSPA